MNLNTKEYRKGDKLILHSKDGHDYDVYIVNVNECRPPEMWYALDIYNDQKQCCTSDDYFFCGEDWLAQCEYIGRADI